MKLTEGKNGWWTVEAEGDEEFKTFKVRAADEGEAKADALAKLNEDEPEEMIPDEVVELTVIDRLDELVNTFTPAEMRYIPVVNQIVHLWKANRRDSVEVYGRLVKRNKL